MDAYNLFYIILQATMVYYCHVVECTSHRSTLKKLQIFPFMTWNCIECQHVISKRSFGLEKMKGTDSAWGGGQDKEQCWCAELIASLACNYHSLPYCQCADDLKVSACHSDVCVLWKRSNKVKKKNFLSLFEKHTFLPLFPLYLALLRLLCCVDVLMFLSFHGAFLLVG